MEPIPTEHTKLGIALQSQRSEEVTAIIERMPSRFGLAVSAIVLFLFILMAIFGWIGRYPDIASGHIVVNASNAPIKLIANGSGKLKLNGIGSLDQVKEGQIIAYIENSTTPFAVDSISQLLKKYNPSSDDISSIRNHVPKNISLGELNIKYYGFINAIQQFMNYKEDKFYDNQKASFNSILVEQRKAIDNSQNQLAMAKSSLGYVYKFYKRDSTLFKKKVISEAELDRTEMSYLSAKDRVQSSTNAVIAARQSIQETQNKIQQLHIEDPEKEKELHINLISSYNDLIDNIKIWEQKYVFKAPFDGKLQYLKFYNENQFVQAGDPIFTIVPINNMPYGQVILPAMGAGKVKLGQEVIVKLDNFPYMEYGSVEGKVKTISLTTNTEKTQNGNIETYLITVDFPNGLKTNYGSRLDFKYESKGTAEIITHDRRLIERLFDNLKYAVKK
ncbi:HlyD family efflux transporter periplasmic adaptor subunit [Pedobacter sp. LMG 31464]|uniref:HlyD family efflux transporter periplasmic adaptor subunit n=1 Tax=Pedobacter planticolens TaxID=2679964 RepID=A0A923IVE1_9SPHI|nr:HlyD family efflux transporter periplasmic adaptor subunit [Pedobacter planticolens]MBB2143952.1 HlyD family efflux transporter periplasmic adaptor subunit [Pedobacter planticolens]